MGSKPGIAASRRHDPALTRHFDGLTLERLLSDAEAVQGLAGHPGWTVLAGLLDAEVALIDRKLDGGLLESRAEYAAAHGRRGGLRAAQQFIEALTARADARLAEQRAKHEGDAAEPATLQEVA